MPKKRWADDPLSGDQAPWLATHIQAFRDAREKGGGSGHKNHHMIKFLNDTFDEWATVFPKALERQDLSDVKVAFDSPVAKRESAFKARLYNWYKAKTKLVAPAIVKTNYISFDSDGRKGALKLPQVFGKVYPEKMELVDKEFKAAVKKWDELYGLPSQVTTKIDGSNQPPPTTTLDSTPLPAEVITEPSNENTTTSKPKKPQWLGFCNSRLSYYWKKATPDEVTKVKKALSDRMKDAAEKAKEEESVSASWIGDEKMSAEEKKRLEHALKVQSNVDSIPRSIDKIHKTLQEKCGALCVTIAIFPVPSDGGKPNLSSHCNGVTLDTGEDFATAFADCWTNMEQFYTIFGSRCFDPKVYELLSLTRLKNLEKKEESDGVGVGAGDSADFLDRVLDDDAGELCPDMDDLFGDNEQEVIRAEMENDLEADWEDELTGPPDIVPTPSDPTRIPYTAPCLPELPSDVAVSPVQRQLTDDVVAEKPPPLNLWDIDFNHPLHPLGTFDFSDTGFVLELPPLAETPSALRSMEDYDKEILQWFDADVAPKQNDNPTIQKAFSAATNTLINPTTSVGNTSLTTSASRPTALATPGKSTSAEG